MSRETALAAAQELRAALLDHGVRAVSIELQTGRGPSVDPWHARTFLGMLSHHIASRPSQGLTPGLALVKAGRTGLPGPLCNAYGGYDLVVRVICLGWANHSGEGGPWTIPAGTVPVNNGRPYLFGWEFEGGFEPYTDDMVDFMARCGAGTLDWLGQPVAAHGEHKTWAPGRKPDRLGFDTARGRAEITRVLTASRPETGPSEEDDDMPNVIYATGRPWAVKDGVALTLLPGGIDPKVYAALGWKVTEVPTSLYDALRGTSQTALAGTAGLEAAVKALSAALAAQDGSDLTAEQIADAVRDGIAAGVQVTGTLNVAPREA